MDSLSIRLEGISQEFSNSSLTGKEAFLLARDLSMNSCKSRTVERNNQH